MKHWLAAKGQGNIEVATYLKAVIARRCHTENLKGMSVERELAANDVGTAAKLPLPKRVADHSSADAAPAIVVALGDQPAKHRLHLENLKETAADPHPFGVARLAALSQVKPLRAPCGNAREGFLLLPQLVPDSEGEFFLPCNRAAHAPSVNLLDIG